MCVCAWLLSCVQLFATPWTVARQAPLSVGFTRREYWSGWPCPSAEGLPNPGMEAGSLALQVESLLLSCLGRPYQSVQFSHSIVLDSLWLRGPQHTPGFPVHHQLLEFTQKHAHRVTDAIQPSHPLSSPSPPAFSLSQYQVFSNESILCIRWPKYWGFSFNISPSNEHSGLISFRMDWLHLLGVQGTLKSLLQHHSSEASILRHSAFFTVQLSHPYMTIGKTIALTRQTFVGKVMSLLFNMLSR